VPSAACLVVFDIDGTLVDAQANIIRGFTDAFVAAGQVPPSAEAIRRTVGLSIEVAIAGLLPGAGPDLVLPLARACREAVWDLRQHPDHAEPLYPRALAALDRLAADGVVLAVATGKGRRGLTLFLEQHGMVGRFAAMQTADDAASKPSPEMLLNIMAATGIDRTRTMMVGDTSFDMGMARAAGVTAIGVGWGYHQPEELLAARARQVLTHFDDLPPLVAELFGLEALR
jgi:phosphoglycolate phosphatase